jgi:hypothetical protein
MRYSSICSSCGIKSEPTESHCPDCGAEKQEILSKTSFYDSIINLLASRIDFLDNSIILVQLLSRILFLLAGIILIPPFIRDSEFFWLACLVFTIFGITKQIENNFLGTKGIYLFSQIFISSYIGAGVGNLISYTGKMHNYSFSYFFNYEFLLKEISRPNSLVIIGIIVGILTLGFITFLNNQFNELNN